MKKFIDWVFGTSHPEIKKYHEERTLKVIDKDVFNKFYDYHRKPTYLIGEKIEFTEFSKPYKRKKKPNWMYQSPYWS